MLGARHLSVMTSAGETKEIAIEVGLHHGSQLSPLLFVIILDVLTEENDEGTPGPGQCCSWTVILWIICHRDLYSVGLCDVFTSPGSIRGLARRPILYMRMIDCIKHSICRLVVNVNEII